MFCICFSHAISFFHHTGGAFGIFSNRNNNNSFRNCFCFYSCEKCVQLTDKKIFPAWFRLCKVMRKKSEKKFRSGGKNPFLRRKASGRMSTKNSLRSNNNSNSTNDVEVVVDVEVVEAMGVREAAVAVVVLVEVEKAEEVADAAVLDEMVDEAVEIETNNSRLRLSSSNNNSSSALARHPLPNKRTRRLVQPWQQHGLRKELGARRKNR